MAVEAPRFRTLIGEAGLSDWPAFSGSWSDLEIDRHMADGGRCRRRRYARFEAARGSLTREPHGPHFQSREYNALNGGIARWFEPVTDAFAGHRITRRLLELCTDVFTKAAAGEATDSAWNIEMHQFRIEPSPREAGKPTPEGMHRDGVDWVFVGLVARTGVAGGITGIGDATGRSLGAFTLSQPLDAVFLDDRRVRHGVTPIQIIAPDQPAYRDVLVLTFRKSPLPQEAG